MDARVGPPSPRPLFGGLSPRGGGVGDEAVLSQSFAWKNLDAIHRRLLKVVRRSVGVVSILGVRWFAKVGAAKELQLFGRRDRY